MASAALGVYDQGRGSEIDRLFFARCRMELPWPAFDFAVDISAVHKRKQAAIDSYASVFQGEQSRLVERYAAEDQYYGSLLGVRYAEPFVSRSPLLVDDPTTAFVKVPFG